MARIFVERRNRGEDIRRWLDRLDDESPDSGTAVEHVPPTDVLETNTAVEVLVDLPGVGTDAVKVIFTEGILVIAGSKLPARCPHREAAFHLAERSFGKFARVLRLTGAFDAGRATATLTTGELLVTVPRIDERRGRQIRVPVKVE